MDNDQIVSRMSWLMPSVLAGGRSVRFKRRRNPLMPILATREKDNQRRTVVFLAVAIFCAFP